MQNLKFSAIRRPQQHTPGTLTLSCLRAPECGTLLSSDVGRSLLGWVKSHLTQATRSFMFVGFGRILRSMIGETEASF